MRPHVFVNVAASLDGKISDETRRQIRLSCKEDLERVDKLRASADAIMIGIGTILADNPKLNVKSRELRERRLREGRSENPIKVVVDSRCRIPEDAEVFDGNVIVAISKLAEKERVEKIEKKARIVVFGQEKVDLNSLLGFLYEEGVRRVMVEGGGTLISSLLMQGLVDEAFIYYAPVFIGGASSPTICDGRSFRVPVKTEILSVERLGEGILLHLRFFLNDYIQKNLTSFTRGMKMRLFTAAILTTLILCLCVGNSKTSSCIADVENAMCSISKDGTAMLTVQNYPSNAKLLDARISPCEITGRLWSCEEIGWKVKNCKIISESQPFKAKCPIESGAWSVKFRILKPEGEETIRIYQIV